MSPSSGLPFGPRPATEKQFAFLRLLSGGWASPGRGHPHPLNQARTAKTLDKGASAVHHLLVSPNRQALNLVAAPSQATSLEAA
jgi:hypothetical protein